MRLNFTKHLTSAVKYAEDVEWVRMQLLLPWQHRCNRLQFCCITWWSRSHGRYETSSLCRLYTHRWIYFNDWHWCTKTLRHTTCWPPAGLYSHHYDLFTVLTQSGILATEHWRQACQSPTVQSNQEPLVVKDKSWKIPRWDWGEQVRGT